MERLLEKFLNKLRDPFNRRAMILTHENILREMETVKGQSQGLISARRARYDFPMSHTAGNPRLRRERA